MKESICSEITASYIEASANGCMRCWTRLPGWWAPEGARLITFKT
jgi:hypothetical protein